MLIHLPGYHQLMKVGQPVSAFISSVLVKEYIFIQRTSCHINEISNSDRNAMRLFLLQQCISRVKIILHFALGGSYSYRQPVCNTIIHSKTNVGRRKKTKQIQAVINHAKAVLNNEAQRLLR